MGDIKIRLGIRAKVTGICFQQEERCLLKRMGVDIVKFMG